MGKNTHTLSDGTTIRVQSVKTIIGTEYREVPSRKRKANKMLRMDGRMYAAFGPKETLIPVRHPDYAYASTDADGARKALAFFVECAEGCIKQAAQEGIPVEQCYSL
ncbi:hypothetical protein [Streptomyces tsukubensis]|uniref:hypothetical protein n=1 Tax=Streptomyces tsukubensis TaxID=83656 RepID=UPI003450A1F0